jgi:hypothetical protein
MQKHIPLLAVVAISAALIAVAVTHGFGAFEARTMGSGGSGCYAEGVQTRTCIENIKKRCRKYEPASSGYRTCMKQIGRPATSALKKTANGRSSQTDN